MSAAIPAPVRSSPPSVTSTALLRALVPGLPLRLFVRLLFFRTCLLSRIIFRMLSSLCVLRLSFSRVCPRRSETASRMILRSSSHLLVIPRIVMRLSSSVSFLLLPLLRLPCRRLNPNKSDARARAINARARVSLAVMSFNPAMKKVLFELLKAICTAVLTAAGVTIAGCTYPTYLN